MGPGGGAEAATTWSPAMISGVALWGLGQGLYLAGDQALSFMLLPSTQEAGRCIGFVTLTTSAGAALGGALCGSLLAGFGDNSALTSGAQYAFPGYAAIFIMAAIYCIVIAML